MDRPAPILSTAPMELWPLIMDQLPDGMVVVDRVDGVLVFNKSARQMLGVSRDELVEAVESRRLHVVATEHPGDTAPRPLENLLAGHLDEGDTGVYALRTPGSEGPQWFEWRVSAFATPGRGVDGVLLLFREVDRTQTDHLYRRLFESHGEAMLLLEPSTSRILDVNHAAATMFSRTGVSLRGQRLSTLFDDPIKLQSLLEPTFGACVKARLRHTSPVEGPRSFEICSTPFLIDGQPRVFAVMHDVTEHEHLHEQMRQAQSISQVGVFEVHLTTGEMTWSEELFALHELEGGEPEFEKLIAKVHPEDRATVADRVQHFLATHEPVQGRYRVVLDSGCERVLAVRGEAVLGASGEVRLVGTTQDVSEHLRLAEGLREYTAQLEQSNRALEDFAYVASHDLQEPLRKILAFSERLSQRYADVLDDRGLQYLERMRGAAGRMRRLIEDLLELSRVSTHARRVEMLEARDLVEDVLEDLEVRVEQSGGEVHVLVDGAVPGDASQLRQLLMNLVGNALKFHKPEHAPEVFVSGAPSMCGELYEFSVRDLGLGMRTEDVEAIFEPFRRLHGRSSKYEGTGIGLALCHKIVERHAGAIRAESAPGEGTTFFITLPMHTRELSGCMGGCLK